MMPGGGVGGVRRKPCWRRGPGAGGILTGWRVRRAMGQTRNWGRVAARGGWGTNKGPESLEVGGVRPRLFPPPAIAVDSGHMPGGTASDRGPPAGDHSPRRGVGMSNVYLLCCQGVTHRGTLVSLRLGAEPAAAAGPSARSLGPRPDG